MRSRRGQSLLNRPPHRAALTLDAYRARLDVRVNALLWDLVNSTLLMGVFLATAYVMLETGAFEQNSAWSAQINADLSAQKLVHSTRITLHVLYLYSYMCF